MFRRLAFISSLLPVRLQPAVRDLYVATTIQNFALATVAVFEPVYLFQSGYRLGAICLFYAGVYLLYILLLPLGVKLCLRFGYEKGMVAGSLLWVALYVLLALSVANHWLLLAAVAVYAVQKALYWPGYHADFAQYSVDEEQGREIGSISFLQTGASILGPVVGGVILATTGFATLFTVVAMLLLVSNTPFLRRPERFEPEAMRYGELWRQLLARVNRRWTLASLGYGEELVAVVLWPIAMAILLSQDSVALGGLVAGTALVTAISGPVLGVLGDRWGTRRILRDSTWLYFATWIWRPLVASPLGVVLTDTVARVSKNGLGVSYAQELYSRARADGRVMVRVMTFELGLALAKAAMALLLAVSFALGAQLWFGFTLAAACTLLYLALVNHGKPR